MADRYINVAILDAAMTSAARVALTRSATSLAELDTLIELATADVQSKMRNSGYATLETQDPAEVSGVVQLATICRVWEMLASRPPYTLKLPDKWEELPYRAAYSDILDGDAQLPEAQSASGAPGGWSFTDATPRTNAGKLWGY